LERLSDELMPCHAWRGIQMATERPPLCLLWSRIYAGEPPKNGNDGDIVIFPGSNVKNIVALNV
jgi:hypothetical protein